MEYTEKVHAQRVLRMFLCRKRVCNYCPAGPQYKVHTNLRKWSNHPCPICKIFIGLSYFDGCPCRNLGAEKAIRQTAKALKDKGYTTGKLAIKTLNNRVKFLIGEI